MKTAWVIWWRYGDSSSAGVLRVYTDEARAEQDLELLQFDDGASKNYTLSAVPLFEPANTTSPTGE